MRLNYKNILIMLVIITVLNHVLMALGATGNEMLVIALVMGLFARSLGLTMVEIKGLDYESN